MKKPATLKIEVYDEVKVADVVVGIEDATSGQTEGNLGVFVGTDPVISPYLHWAGVQIRAPGFNSFISLFNETVGF